MGGQRAGSGRHGVASAPCPSRPRQAAGEEAAAACSALRPAFRVLTQQPIALPSAISPRSSEQSIPLPSPPPSQAANKEKAVAAAVEASDAAAERGDKFLVTQMDVGLDAKALQARCSLSLRLLPLAGSVLCQGCGASVLVTKVDVGWHAQALQARQRLRLCLGHGRRADLGPRCGTTLHAPPPGAPAAPLPPGPLLPPSPTAPLNPPAPPTRCPPPEQEAWNAIQRKHPALPVLFVSVGEDKAMAYAGVPQDLSKQLPAGEGAGRAWHALAHPRRGCCVVRLLPCWCPTAQALASLL